MKIKEINQYVKQLMKEFNLPSLGLGISYQGETFSQVYGDANQDTLYPLASISKTFFATAVCKLADEGKIDLDKPLKAYWPDLRMVDPYVEEHMTFRDALSHQSGLPAHDLMRFTNCNKQDLSLAEKVKAIGHLKPNHELRFKMQYSNLIYAVATYVMERIIGEDYGCYIRKNLLDPLDLRNTYINHHECERSRIAAPFLIDHGTVRQVPFIAPGKVGGASSMLATISDLLKWAQFQLKTKQKGHGLTMERYKPQSIMQVDRAYGGANFSNYGLGMMMEDYHGFKYFFHSGSYIGYCSFLGFVPELDLAFVSTMNMDSTDAIFALAYKIIDLFAGIEGHDWIKVSSDFMKNRNQKKRVRVKQLLGNDFHFASSSQEILGDYQNNGYGIITLSDKDSILMANIGKLRFPVVEKQKGQNFIDVKIADTLIPISFLANEIRVQTEPKLNEPTVFAKI